MGQGVIRKHADQYRLLTGESTALASSGADMYGMGMKRARDYGEASTASKMPKPSGDGELMQVRRLVAVVVVVD